MCGEAENSEGAGRLLDVWPLLFCRWLCTPLALSTCFLTVFLCHVFLAYVRVGGVSHGSAATRFM